MYMRHEVTVNHEKIYLPIQPKSRYLQEIQGNSVALNASTQSFVQIQLARWTQAPYFV